VLQDREAPELRPWERAPVSGYYHLLNVFGTPTGEKAFVEEGALVPSAPRAHTWRLKNPSEDEWVSLATR
jgi:hypothetical protein